MCICLCVFVEWVTRCWKSMCVFCVCVCVLVRESGCRNQVKRKSNTWLNRGDFGLNLLQPKMNMQCFHMCKCVHLCFCMFAHVPAGFIVTSVSARWPVCLSVCVCACHACDQRQCEEEEEATHQGYTNYSGNNCNTQQINSALPFFY